MPQSSNFELRRKLLQLEALYDVGRAINTLRPEGELIEEDSPENIFRSPKDLRTKALIDRYRTGGAE